MKIFASGSCRILNSLNNGYDKIIPIHSLYHGHVGINFLGKLHNTRQHIQFIKFIKDDLNVPENILQQFLTSYTGVHLQCGDPSLNPFKKNTIKNQFDECDWYIIEISSLKLYINNGYEVQYELTNNYEYRIQTVDELIEDLHTLRKIIPNKKILFQCHFRPNIIYDNETKAITKREVIYNTLLKFCNNNNNVFLYDPSIIIKNNNFLFDGDTHFTDNGYIENFKYIYNNYLVKY